MPAISGADALVPPVNIQPWRKQSPAVQWTMYPRRPAVAFSETSGTSRQTPAERWQGTPLEKLLMTPAPACQPGFAQNLEIPPPPAPNRSFHATSRCGPVRSRNRDVPPTAVAYGCAAGSSTESGGRLQSSDPWSPLPTSTDIPATAASCRAVLVAAIREGVIRVSHSPQETLTTCTPVDGCSATIWSSTDAIEAVGGAM